MVALTKGDGKEQVKWCSLSTKPTPETLTRLSPTGIQFGDAKLVSTAQGLGATFSSLMLPKVFWSASSPPKSRNFKDFSFLHSPGTEIKSDTYSSFDFDTQILLNEVKIIILQAVIKRCWRKQSVTHGDGEVPFSTATSTPASLDWGETTHCVFSSCGQHHLPNHQSHYPHPPPLHLHRHHHW